MSSQNDIIKDVRCTDLQFSRTPDTLKKNLCTPTSRFKHDPRAQLYIDYLRYVEAFAPLAVVVENVPDVLNHGGQNIAERCGSVGSSDSKTEELAGSTPDRGSQ
jgi:hypothetical protein